MIVVTAGKRYLDIDAYACIVAYAELLNLEGRSAVAVSTATMNDSIIPSARELKTDFRAHYTPTDEDKFVIMDVSEPDNLDAIVKIDRVVEVIDHHLGNESYWREHGAQTDIEFIGAACTQVYERWQQAQLVDRMSNSSARLLSLGILDNTLNFNATITTRRDKDAYDSLTRIANTPVDWANRYFEECQVASEAHLESSIANDTKQVRFPGYATELTVGQLVVWDASGLIDWIREQVCPMEHFINIISINEGVNYIIAKDKTVQQFLVDILPGSVAVGDIVKTNRLWLRKEIMKAAIDAAGVGR